MSDVETDDGGMANERQLVTGQRLGRLPLKTTRKALQFADFFRFVRFPERIAYWTRATPLPRRTFGNDQYGNCTRAKQAYAAIRMERIEQKRTIDISDEEVVRVYQQMSDRLYGGGDNGAYEDDALNEWRNPETTFRDTKGHPLTIDAYLRINALNHQEVHAGLALSGAKGIAVCFNLPVVAQRMDVWDVPEGQPLIGPWQPGSWGGHSCWLLCDYDDFGGLGDDTWGFGLRKISWRFMAAYMDEAHLVIDSVDGWRAQSDDPKVLAALGDVVDEVNAISSLTIRLA